MSHDGARHPLAVLASIAVIALPAIGLLACAPGDVATPATSAPATSAPATSALASTPFIGERRPVVIDTDMAADDWLAILYLLNRPEVEVVAITVTGAGEAHCEPGVRNALALVSLAGARDTPVACGRETPLAGDHAFPNEWRAGVDSLFDISIPDGAAPSQATAVELLTGAVSAAPGDVTILVLGPFTNIAEAIEADGAFAEAVREVVVMGGAVEVEGNVGSAAPDILNSTAEWNIYCDPLAAKRVLESGMAVTLVPLDATNSVPLTASFEAKLAEDRSTPSASFAGDVIDRLHQLIAGGGYYFWDPLAAAILVDETLAAFDERPLTVETAEGPDSGRIIDNPDGPTIRFAVSAEGARFEQSFLDTLNARVR